MSIFNRQGIYQDADLNKAKARAFDESLTIMRSCSRAENNKGRLFCAQCVDTMECILGNKIATGDESE